MIIAIAGRKGSGKSELANLLIERGFKKASFAFALKDYVSKLFHWEIEDLQTQEGKESLLSSPVVWNQEKCNLLSSLTGLSIQFEKEVKFSTRREALQHIGTEVLRKTNEDFHVNEFKKRFSHGNYVCDDLRFPNELVAVKEMNAICVHLMRPFFWDYSNHSSENSLSNCDFDYCLINNKGLKTLKRRFSMFLDHILLDSKKRTPFSREKFLEIFKKHNGNTTNCAAELNCSHDKIIWWCCKFLIPIDRNTYSLNHGAFAKANESCAYWAGVISADGCIKKHQKYDYLLELASLDECLINGFKNFLQTNKPVDHCTTSNGNIRYTLCVSSPYLIEDLKLWNVEPKKSKWNKIPDVIRHDEKLLKYWLMGLIDGDGSIYITKSGNLGIQILASLQIIDFVDKWLGIQCSRSSEKGIENLWKLNYSGKYAVEFYNRVYQSGFGLDRKWSKVKPFLNKVWYH